MAKYYYFKTKPKGKRRSVYWLPLLLSLTGTVVIANVVFPMLHYQVKSNSFFQKKLLSPIGSDNFQVLGNNQSLDYNRPQSWFPLAPNLPPRQTKITHYTISIPKLEIENAVVEIGGEDLNKSLVQYSGTAVPGQTGGTVIFGHSSLPQFFNPKNYHSIFSTLPDLKKGDEILVDFDGITYRYQVAQMLEVEPSDISVLTQSDSNQSLVLVTCVPPGTLYRRLIVRAQLV